jgi:hypothetical protein
MAEPMDRASFEALMKQAGLRLAEDEFARLQEASALVLPILARLRAPRPMALEPATIFVPEPTR